MSPCAAVMVLPPGRAGVITGLSKAGVAASRGRPVGYGRACSGSRLGFDPHNDAHRAQSARSRDGQHQQHHFFSLFFEKCTPP